jgi:hypothetical protein
MVGSFKPVITCATGISSALSPSRRFGPGRVCGHPGCGTRLSTYNPLDWCSVHTPPREFHMRAPRRKRREVAT